MTGTPEATPASARKRSQQLSSDGKWRSFPNVPNLLKYVGSGAYYGRIKVRGKVIRESLQTSVWTTAKLRLAVFLKRQQAARSVVPTLTFSESVEQFKRELEGDATIKPRSREYRLLCLGKIEETRPKLWSLHLEEITEQACRDWAAGLRDKLSTRYFNNTIGTLRLVIGAGIKMHKAQAGVSLDNPAAGLGRARVRQKELKLPEPSQFKELVAYIRAKSGGYGERVGDLVEFLAYGGMRIHSEAAWVTWTDVDWKRGEIIVRGDPETATKNSEMRRVMATTPMRFNHQPQAPLSFGCGSRCRLRTWFHSAHFSALCQTDAATRWTCSPTKNLRKRTRRVICA